jgi:membrane protease YdiL (CAAX protease family)
LNPAHRLRLVWWSILVTLPVILAYSSRASGDKPDDDTLYRYSTAVGAAVLYAIMLLVVLAIAGFDRNVLALRRPRRLGRAIGLSAAVFVSAFVAIALLDQVLHGGEEQGLTPDTWQPDRAGAYVASFVVLAFIGPFVEELTFRGLGYTLLEQYGRWAAILITGVIFGLQHGLVQGLPELVLFGCALAWLRSETDSVYPCVVLHSLFNGIALIGAVVA